MKKPVILLVGSILASAFALYELFYIGGITQNVSLASMLFGRMVTPHLVCAMLGTVLCWCAWGLRQKWLALGAAASFLIAIAVLPAWAWLVALQGVLCFTGFLMMLSGSAMSQQSAVPPASPSHGVYHDIGTIQPCPACDHVQPITAEHKCVKCGASIGNGFTMGQ